MKEGEERVPGAGGSLQERKGEEGSTTLKRGVARSVEKCAVRVEAPLQLNCAREHTSTAAGSPLKRRIHCVRNRPLPA